MANSKRYTSTKRTTGSRRAKVKQPQKQTAAVSGHTRTVNAPKRLW